MATLRRSLFHVSRVGVLLAGGLLSSVFALIGWVLFGIPLISIVVLCTGWLFLETWPSSGIFVWAMAAFIWTMNKSSQD